MKLATRWNEFWFAPQAPWNLGICRILFFAIVLWLFRSTTFYGYAEMGPGSAFWQPIWLFHSMHLPLFSASVLSTITIAWKVSLALACIGLLTRISTLSSLVLTTYLIGMSYNYGKSEASTMPLVFVMAALALSRCGDVLSVDAWLRSRRMTQPIRPTGEYRWPVRMAWLVMAIGFGAAGIAKLRHTGIAWATGDGMSFLLMRGYFDNNPPATHLGLYIANHAWMSRCLAGGSMFVELFFPLALFDRRARRFFPLAAFGMQSGIGFIMNIWFMPYLAVYAFWVPWDRILGLKSAQPPVEAEAPRTLNVEIPPPSEATNQSPSRSSLFVSGKNT